MQKKVLTELLTTDHVNHINKYIKFHCFYFFFPFISVPMEITTFLGAAFAFIALGLVFFLYINRKWCFKPPKGSFSSCDESLLASTKTIHNFSKYS